MNRVSQYLVYPVVWFFSKFFLKIEWRGYGNLATITGKPAIIIANHISFYDSFLLRLNSHWTSLDIFFMGVTRFNELHMRVLWYTGLIPLVYWLFGVFVVVPGNGLMKNLEAPQKLISMGKQVFIFPEGSMNTTGKIKPFKLGAATLATITHVPILPIVFKRVFSDGKSSKIVITVGEKLSFSADQSAESINKVLEVEVNKMFSA